MKTKTQLSTLFLVLFSLALTLAYAEAPKNDTVQLNMTINTPPNITIVTFDDYTPLNDDIDLTAGTNKTVYCIINASDYDGYDNINLSSLNVSISNRGFTGAEDPKNEYILAWNNLDNNHACLNQTYGGTSTLEGSIILNCSIQMPYYTENGTWICNASILDNSNNPLRVIAFDPANIMQLIALNISTESIDFGFIALGENRTEAQDNTTIENIGNVPLRVNVTASWNDTDLTNDTYAMKCVQGYVNETDIKFNASGSYEDNIGNWNQLDTGFTPATQMSLTEAAGLTRKYLDIFWGINLINSQSSTPKGACKGWLFFDAIMG
jgi:hypothetical protein